MKKILFPLLMISMLALSACAGGASSNSKDGASVDKNNTKSSEAIEWDFNLHVGLDQGPGVYMTEFTKAVKERTNGKLDIVPRPPGELPYKGMESVRVVGDRSIEMADAPVGYIAGDVKAAIIPTWPFLASENMDVFKKAVDAVMPYAEKELADHGIEVLFFLQDPPQRIWGKGKPVKKLEDLKGLKIRTFAPEQQEFLKKLGAIPVSLAFSEVPAAIQRGVIDAAITGATGAHDAKWDEFLDWGYDLPFSGSGAFMLVNSAALAELPEETRAIVEEEAKKWEEKGNAEAIGYEDTAIKGLTDKGVKIYKASPEDFAKAQEIVRPYWEKWSSTPLMKEALDKVLTSIE
ncbi:hypothetical protein CVD28_18515 [Bacillus sp. M6-12]|uniref:TRAP transporter substrate-binding protein n=1 Tax=Bacillus sp. M6-12 TaxID=2054166 RepID=UPI000C7623BF|nr:TRAP transporter substrate-binding protein DctP [Bacillus sp. M6-12]PLS16044.1 hypothetical protein CVD28_18515 [Bacillus sp. M6-12]